ELLVIPDELLDDRFAFRHQGAHSREQDLLLGAKVSDQIVGEKFAKLNSALFQSLRTHRLQLTERLLTAAQRQSQTMMMIVRQ
ncbi:MAG: hypothetical protein U1E51_06985, partial [Candidatus Binatia bacterium]|nr:hypothetical protein [Candidatus Binatia bacterium]